MSVQVVDSAPKRRWTEWLYLLALTLLALSLVATIAAAIAHSVSGWRVPLSTILGSYLFGFALLKFSVATDAVLRMRSKSGPDPLQTHGNAPMAWSWIIYRYVAAALATGMAIYILTAAADRVNAFLLK